MSFTKIRVAIPPHHGGGRRDDAGSPTGTSFRSTSRCTVGCAETPGRSPSSTTEAQPLSYHRILAIELGWHVDRQCDASGNCGVERAELHFVDEHGSVRHGEVVDLHLACQ
jgi:hypothetical protein